jgi:HD-like signal output (HDOD) protein
MRKITLLDPEECFCAGLIHDIGRIVLDQHFHEEFVKAVVEAKASGISLVDSEKRELGFDHTEVGDWLTARWELPHEIRSPIIHHHSPREAAHAKEITSLVHLADHLCYEIDFSLPGVTARPYRDSELIEQMGFSEDDLDAVRADSIGEIEKMKVLLEL